MNWNQDQVPTTCMNILYYMNHHNRVVEVADNQEVHIGVQGFIRVHREEVRWEEQLRNHNARYCRSKLAQEIMN